uniref:Guanine nucleotide exchange factor DBS n=2 Tax=Plectus sambesii TaxID=2011161 RepID=A0A914UMR1_9BILA
MSETPVRLGDRKQPTPALWDEAVKSAQQDPASCYGSMIASTSSNSCSGHTVVPSPAYDRIERDEDSTEFIEAPKFQYDLDFDLKALKNALMSAEYLEESGYQSVLDRSQHSLYGTGWMVADNVSVASHDSEEDWDGNMDVGGERIKVKEMSDILAARYAFLSGARTRDGFPVMTFPDSRVQMSYPNYHLLVTYLLQVPPLEDSHKGYVLVVDRRMDKWSSIRTLFVHLSNHFPGPVRVLFLLKPEGVLQRALEVGYRTIADSCQFKVVICQNTQELRHYVGKECLTMDVGGVLKYNHLEWVQHRMDIERMKSSASVIAQSLSEFGRCLKETELPNDVETTAHILEIQRAERDSIKEDFRISIRKGLSLLRHVRQVDAKPRHEQLSPTRLHNVTAIERMLIQLEETERSFDAFWGRHEKRLTECLELRRFEEGFRKLQAAFAKHMIYLEEHREVGDGPDKAQTLADAHADYAKDAMEDVEASRALRSAGQDLISTQDVELAGSLLPKCDELARMADALAGALERRAAVLKLSKEMHEQIASANQWCKRGVDILSNGPYELSPGCATSALSKLDDFLCEGQDLHVDMLNQGPDINNLMLLTTTETSTLLAQVSERINDVRRMCAARRDVLQKMVEREQRKPVQVVSPEKSLRTRKLSMQEKKALASPKRQIEVLHDFSTEAVQKLLTETPAGERSSLASFVISELVSTEQIYARELRSVVDFYLRPFDDVANQPAISPSLRGRADIVFGNLEELVDFHERQLLPDFNAAGESAAAIARCFSAKRDSFLSLYNNYCQNKPRSEALRRDHVDACKFFADCQKRAGHPLPLSAYLLKPVQRITKYQLLLKELRRHANNDAHDDIDVALDAMLDLLAQLNAAMHQLHISGYPGDLSALGPMRLQSECDVFAFKRKARKTNKAQKRHLLLFDGALLFCKRRTQSAPHAPEYFEHKLCLPTSSLGFAETSKGNVARFEVWDEGRSEGFAVQPPDDATRQRWIGRLSKAVAIRGGQHRITRPHSWASTVSSESTTSNHSLSDDTIASVDTVADCTIDPNGNQQSPSPTSVANPSTDVRASTDSDRENNFTKDTSVESLSTTDNCSSQGGVGGSPGHLVLEAIV